jgi:hypothetical protein
VVGRGAGDILHPSGPDTLHKNILSIQHSIYAGTYTRGWDKGATDDKRVDLTVARSRTYSWASPAKKVRLLKKKLAAKIFSCLAALTFYLLNKNKVRPHFYNKASFKAANFLGRWDFIGPVLSSAA